MRLGKLFMDIATGLGLLAGVAVVTTMIFMGGDLRMFVSEHAIIIIFGGSFAATLIRFPFAVDHARPAARREIRLHACAASSQRELVDEIAGLAEIARKSGPIGLEKIETEDPFLAKGMRFVADGYDANFIRDNLERDRDNFLTHLDEGQKIYRAVGDCAPAFGMIGTLIGMVQMFANMTDPSKLGPFMAVALLATLYGALVANLFCLPIADKLHLKLVDEEINRTLIIDGILMIREVQEPDAGARNAARLSAREASPRRSRAGARVTRRLSGARHGQEEARRAHGGGHGWFVTFADLMGLMMSFFVMLVAFSTQDKRSSRSSPARCATPSACSRCAIPASSRSDGLPTRPTLKNAAHINPKKPPTRRGRTSSNVSERGRASSRRPRIRARGGLVAPGDAGHAGNIRDLQAHHDRGDQAGLNIEIVDQDGRSMFPEGAKEPYERTRRIIQSSPRRSRRCRTASRSPATPRRAGCRRGRAMAPWELSADRANAVRQKLERRRACRPRMSSWSRAGPTPSRCFRTIRHIAANRRVTITLMREEPPLPPDFKP